MKKLLIVDDTVTNLRLLEILLAKCGCEIQSFVTPEDCLQWVTNNGPEMDLVILDYQMPGMNGDQLAAQLRRVGVSCHIIILTGYNALSKDTLVPGADVAGIMNKPISISDVNYIVKRWSDKGQVMEARREGRRQEVRNNPQEVFLYLNGCYISFHALCLNQSDGGIAFLVHSPDSSLVSPGNEIVLNNGVNYSVRWTRQRTQGQCFGACTIES